MNPPEFTITCHTRGGPATTVEWQFDRWVNASLPKDHEMSQVIVDTSQYSVYENRLRIRGRANGAYFCIIWGDQQFLAQGILEVEGV